EKHPAVRLIPLAKVDEAFVLVAVTIPTTGEPDAIKPVPLLHTAGRFIAPEPVNVPPPEPIQFPFTAKHPEERLIPPPKEDVALFETVSFEVEAIPEMLIFVVVALVVVALPAISPPLNVCNAVHVLFVPRPAPLMMHVPFTEKHPEPTFKG